jgi:fatty-acid peroxygenase
MAASLPFDSTLGLRADPYRFISRECRRLDTDLFETRILLRPTVCMTGPEAVRLFYDPNRFMRNGAAPEPLRATLFGKGGVQGLDDEMHLRRKALFVALLTPHRVESLAQRFEEAWRYALPRWTAKGQIVLYRAVQPLLTRAVCDWAGVPVPKGQADAWAAQLVPLFDQAASLHHLRARRARSKLEGWLSTLIDDIRQRRRELPPGYASREIALHLDADGRPMAPRVAAVELLNVLRPTVAVSVYIAFVAHALQLNPQWRERLSNGDAAEAHAFVQEVRRLYPFFPAVVARTREAFEWKDHRFKANQRVMLDLYGTNHDPRSWSSPDEFRPQRFFQRAPGPFDFVPQGGGDAERQHRCPGEGVATTLMKVALRMLVMRMRYTVPEQDLSIDFRRLPALPKSGFVMSDVRPR